MSMLEPAVQVDGFDTFVNGGIPKSAGDKIKILSNLGTTAVICIRDEDHTLGNALRFMIMKNPNVEFCGYSIPHPSEYWLNMRVQVKEGTAIEAFYKGLDDLMDLFTHIKQETNAKINLY